MTLKRFLRGIPVRDANTATIRTWLRFLNLASFALIISLFGAGLHLIQKRVLFGIVLLMPVVALAGAIYDWRILRVRYPRQKDPLAQKRILLVALIGSATSALLIFWIWRK